MRSKRGFTLIEILALIVILGVLAAVAVPVYIGISGSIREKLLETKMQELKSKSEQYAEDTGKIVFDVATLIQEGYITADNELGEYKDPVTGRDMGCDVIHIAWENGGMYYEASIEASDVCYELEELENLYGMVELYVLNDRNEEIQSNFMWLKEKNIKVKYRLKGDFIDQIQEIEDISWRGLQPIHCTIGQIEDSCQEYVVTANDNSIRNVKVQLQIKLRTKNGIQITSNVSKEILLDIQEPYLVSDSIYVTNDMNTSGKRRVEFQISDGSGSGVAGYSVVTNTNGNVCESATYKSANEGTQVEYLGDAQNNTYYICVKDQVGNVVQSSSLARSPIEVKYVDNERPVIKNLIASNTWAQTNRITAVVQDATSGIVGYAFTSSANIPSTWNKEDGKITELTYTYDVNQNGTYYFFAMDRTGNVSSKSVVVNKVDTEAPTQSFSPNGKMVYSPWYNSLSLTVTAKDSQSGLASAKYCITTAASCTPNIAIGLNNKNGDKTRSYTVSLPSYVSNRRVCSEVIDMANRSSGVSCSDPYLVDSDNPTSSFYLTYTNFTNYVSVYAQGSSDSHSKIRSYVYKLDSGSEVTSSLSNYTFYNLSAGGHTVSVYVIDNAGNRSTVATKTFTVSLDNKPPVIQYSKSNVWTYSDMITATITDNESGLAGYYWTNTEVTPTTWYTLSSNSRVVTKSLTSNRTVYLWAKDQKGNISHVAIVENLIDRNEPVINFPYIDPATWQYAPRTISFSAVDYESGLKSLYYRFAGQSNYILYTGPVSVTSSKITVKAEDKAGNIALNYFTTMVDQAAPYTPVLDVEQTQTDSNVYSISCQTNEHWSHNVNECTINVSTHNFNFWLYESDDDYGSGIVKRVHEIWKNDRFITSSTCDLYTESTCYFTYSSNSYQTRIYAVDKAGNRSTNPLILNLRFGY